MDFSWDGSYGVLENIGFFHKTRHVIDGDHLAFRNIGVTNPVDAFIDFNPVVSLRGHDLLIYESEIVVGCRSLGATPRLPVGSVAARRCIAE